MHASVFSHVAVSRQSIGIRLTLSVNVVCRRSKELA